MIFIRSCDNKRIDVNMLVNEYRKDLYNKKLRQFDIEVKDEELTFEEWLE